MKKVSWEQRVHQASQRVCLSLIKQELFVWSVDQEMKRLENKYYVNIRLNLRLWVRFKVSQS
jgi:hypothetical protein